MSNVHNEIARLQNEIRRNKEELNRLFSMKKKPQSVIAFHVNQIKKHNQQLRKLQQYTQGNMFSDGQ